MSSAFNKNKKKKKEISLIYRMCHNQQHELQKPKKPVQAAASLHFN